MNDYMVKAWIVLDAHARQVVDSMRRRREEGADFLEWLGGMAIVVIVLGLIATYLSAHQQGIGSAVWTAIHGLIGKVTNLGQGTAAT